MSTVGHPHTPAQALRPDSRQLRKFFSELLLCAPDDRPDLELLLFDSVRHDLRRVPLAGDAVDLAVRASTQTPTLSSTLAVFQSGKPRQLEYVRGHLGLWVDFDVVSDDADGHGRGFQAEKDLRQFLEHLEKTVPPSILTRTKRGRHALWLFDEMVDDDEVVRAQIDLVQRTIGKLAIGDTRSKAEGVSKARRHHWNGRADIANATMPTRPWGSIRRKEGSENLVEGIERPVRRYGCSELLELIELHFPDEAAEAVGERRPDFSAARQLERGPAFEKLLELLVTKAQTGKLKLVSKGAGVRLPSCPVCQKKGKARLSFAAVLHCFGGCAASDEATDRRGLPLEAWGPLAEIRPKDIEAVRSMLRDQRQSERERDAIKAEGKALIPVGSDRLTRCERTREDFESVDLPLALRSQADDALDRARAGRSVLWIVPPGSGKSRVMREKIVERLETALRDRPDEAPPKFAVFVRTHNLAEEYRADFEQKGRKVRHLKGIATACEFKAAANEAGAIHWRWTACPSCPLRKSCEAMVRPTEETEILIATFDRLQSMKPEELEGRAIILDEMPTSVSLSRLTEARYLRTAQRPELFRSTQKSQGVYGPTTEERDDSEHLTRFGALLETLVAELLDFMVEKETDKKTREQRQRHGFEADRADMVAALERSVGKSMPVEEFLDQFEESARVLEEYATGQAVQVGVRQLFDRALAVASTSSRSSKDRDLEATAERFPHFGTPSALVSLYRVLRGAVAGLDVSMSLAPSEVVVVDPGATGEADPVETLRDETEPSDLPEVRPTKARPRWTLEVRKRRQLPGGFVCMDATGLLTIDELRAISTTDLDVVATDVEPAADKVLAWIQTESAIRTSLAKGGPAKFVEQSLGRAIRTALAADRVKAALTRYKAAGQRLRVSVLTFKGAADWLRDAIQRSERSKAEALELLGLDPDDFEVVVDRIGHYGSDERGINTLDADLLIEAGDPRGNLAATAADARTLGLAPELLGESRMQADKAQATARVRWLRARPLPPIVLSVGAFPPPGWSGDFLRMLAEKGRTAKARKSAKAWLLEALVDGQEVTLGEGEAIRQIPSEESSSTQSVGSLPEHNWRTLARAAQELVDEGLAELVNVPRPGRKAGKAVRLASALQKPLPQMSPTEQVAAGKFAEVALRRMPELVETWARMSGQAREAVEPVLRRCRDDLEPLRRSIDELVGLMRRQAG